MILCVIGFLIVPKHVQTAGIDDWLPIDPNELKMTNEPLAPGAPAVYLYRQVDRDDSGIAKGEKNYIRVKILTEEGRKYANVEIPFEKDRYKVTSVRARTIRPDGISKLRRESLLKHDREIKERQIPGKDLFDVRSDGGQHRREYKYTYDFVDNYIFNSHWILSEELFTKKAKKYISFKALA